MLSAIKKINMDNFSSPWRNGLCDGCSIRFNMFKRKRMCNFCKCNFCNMCLMRRPDRKLSCRKCQILTARPLDRDELLNLKSRDLVNYLTSRHISTSGCVEKEDLVNALMRAVNNSSYHTQHSVQVEHDGPQGVPMAVDSSPVHSSSTSPSSYPNSPHNTHFLTETLNNGKRKYTQSATDLSSHDGIRVRASEDRAEAREEEDTMPTTEADSLADFVVVDLTEEVTMTSPVVELPPEPEEVLDVDEEAAGAAASSLVVEEIVEEVKETVKAAAPPRPLQLSDITCKGDLEQLTVKQLKELLLRNRTDYKGCVERPDLVEKVNRLWCDYVLSRKDLEKLSLEELCKICMDAPIECVLLECGHMATCTACGKQLSECPICRQLVVRCVRTFKA